jgi:oxalate decarboxylase/phosphoglucose isomerase-like protein (cupin superfamily)
MDPMDSLYVVLSGKKTVTLFSPDQSPSLHTVSPTYGVSPDGFAFQYNSPANLPALDNSQMQGHEVGKGYYHYSALLGAELQNGNVVELQAGDVLYLPAGWYHEVSY